jgi:hypothetical protein
MMSKHPKGSAENEKARNGTGKKVYQKPAFRHERVFETLALACGKTNPFQATCKFNRKRS